MARSQAPNRPSVICLCGWVGKRSRRQCTCEYDMCDCALYGTCPKCGTKIRTTVAQRRSDQEAEAYYRAHEAEILADLPASVLRETLPAYPCVVCDAPGELEPRFGYAVCPAHANILPAEVHQHIQERRAIPLARF